MDRGMMRRMTGRTDSREASFLMTEIPIQNYVAVQRQGRPAPTTLLPAG